MASVYLNDTTLTAIGDAIRAKAGNTDMLFPSEMATAISNLPTGGGNVSYDYYKLNPKYNSTLQKIELKWTDYISDISKLASMTICWGKSYTVATMLSNQPYQTANGKRFAADIRTNEGTIIFNDNGYIMLSDDGNYVWITELDTGAAQYAGSGQFTVQICVRK